MIDDSVKTLRDLIDRAAFNQPDAGFLISPEVGRIVTFKGVQEEAVHLYGQFRQMGLRQGDKIAFLMDNGLYTAQLFLGTMYGGFVTVPLNVRAGGSQLSYTLDHCDATVVFVAHHYKDLITDVMGRVRRPIQVIFADVDDGPDRDERPATAGALPPVRAEDAVMLMYTSGSTGQPKGAVHTHRSVLAHGRNSICSHRFTAADRSLLVLPLYHINAECVTLIPMLMSGGSVVVPHQFVISEFWNWLDDYRCSWSALVPTIISQLLDWNDPKADKRVGAFQRIRFLRVSSAPLSPSLHREFSQKFALPLLQAMGSSEAGNVFSNPLPPATNKVGSPGLAWGFDTRIIDREGADLPAGVPGEVLIRGEGLMCGYYKDLDGTATALDADGWLHTDDLAYRDHDGYLFVVGRSKELIIKGGMNIAPKQIDEVMEAHPAVLEAAAVGVPDRYVGEDIIGFAVLRDGMSCSERELLSFCEAHLGHFKTPTRVHFAQDLPKGPSGKVQRLRLMEAVDGPMFAEPVTLTGAVRASHAGADGDRRAPSTTDLPVEQIIARVWSDLLGQPAIDPWDNFFALGGQSVQAIQCLSRLREQIPVMLSLSDFFEHATIAQQAALVRDRMSEPAAWKRVDGGRSRDNPQPIPPRDRTLPCPLSSAQERLWFMDQLISGEPAYNECEAVRLKGRLDVKTLERAFNAIVARHEILRSTIEVTADIPVAIVHASWPVKFKTIDLSPLPADQREAELARLLIDEPRRPYRLDSEPGVRATIVRITLDEHAFILMMHHIVCDSSSLGIFWRELGTLYEAFMQGQPDPLPPLPIQYGDYATWQRQPFHEARIREDLAFWSEKLLGAPMALDLPGDHTRPTIMTYRGDRRSFQFAPALAADMRRLCRQEHTSLFTVIAAALSALVYRYTGQEDILVGIPIADRDRPELQPLIGLLIDTQILRTDLSGSPTFRELLVRVRHTTADAYSHRAAPFNRVVEILHPERDMSRAIGFQVLLIWRDRDDRLYLIGFPGLITEPMLAQARIAKFDLTLFVTDTGDAIDLDLEFSTDLFNEQRIERMVGHLRTLLEGAIENSDQRLEELPLLTSEERRQLLFAWNHIDADEAHS